MKITKKLKKHFDKKRFARITRKISKYRELISRGYIQKMSEDFVILQETDDFRIFGFNILPISDFKNLRYNLNDEYYDRIMEWEGKKKKLGLKTKVNLSDWNSIFKSLKKNEKSIVVECEHPKIDSFTIGKITKVTNKKVFIHHFNAVGLLDEKPTEIKFKNITNVHFDDRYIDVFTKYLKVK